MEQRLRELLREKGAALVGFADLTSLPEQANRGYPRAVSDAVALTPAVVARIPGGPHREYSDEYDDRNTQLDGMGLAAEAFLREQGYKALAVVRGVFPKWTAPADETPLPHKTAARLAGLGWVGKCATLVTPAYGNAVRFTTVLTDAPLAAGTPMDESRCGDCTACQRACPAKAVKGVNYSPQKAAGLSPMQGRALLYDAAACRAELDRRARQYPGYHATCGQCIAHCPYTLQYIKRAMATGAE